jgi:trehalose 6-phosphate synthase
VQRLRDQFRRELGLEACRVGLGVDRLDYTKGIPERLRALDLLFTKHPSYCGRFTFVQVGVPSRSQIPEYESVDDEVQHLVDQVNWRHQRGSWKPIVYLRRQFDAKALWALYGLANVCVVSSLHDGMNLVAKEYVASRVDNTGVLVLSKFAGAATELTDSLEINPYDAESFAAALQHALEMPLAEQERRMTRMRALVGENAIYRWAGRLLSQFWRLEAPTPTPSQASSR